MTIPSDRRAAIHAALTDTPHAALEDIAQAAGASVAEVLACLPRGEAVLLPSQVFEQVMADIARWGEITLVINTGDVILEAKGTLPEGKVAQGYFNLHGKPIGGHIRAGACAKIAFVSRSLFGMETRSVQMLDGAGACMFKIYLGRDAARALIPAQVAAFEALRDLLTEEVAA